MFVATGSDRLRFGVRWFSYAIVLVAAALPAFVVGRLAVNVPLDDEWAWIPMLDHVRTGTLTFVDLWQQHNEHRMLFPGLLTIALTGFGGTWNVVRECVASLAFAVLGFLAWLATLRHFLSRTVASVAAAASATLVFTLAQFHNWLWGYQCAWFLIAACVLAAAYVVATGDGSRRDFARLVILALLASFSSAQGLALWPAVGIACGLARRFRGRQTGLWWSLAIVAYATYFNGFEHPAASPSLSAGVENPLGTVRYLAAYMGGPLFGYIGIVQATSAGTIGLFAAIALIVAMLRQRSPLARADSVVVFLIAYAVLDGAITTFGRVGLGAEQALASRYVTSAVPLWLACVLALATVTDRFRAPALLIVVLIGVCAAGNAWSSRAALREFALREDEGAVTFRYLPSASDAEVRLMFPSASLVRAYAASLRNLESPKTRP